MAHIIQFIFLFLILCIGTAIIISRRLTVQRSVNLAANTRIVKCKCPNYELNADYAVVENPFLGHRCRYYEYRVFQPYCRDHNYSPIPSNTACLHIYKSHPNDSQRFQIYHTWSDKCGNFYVYDPFVDVYAKWDTVGNYTTDWGLNPSYVQDIIDAEEDDNVRCFNKFNRKWCHFKDTLVSSIFTDFIWNPFLGKKCGK